MDESIRDYDVNKLKNLSDARFERTTKEAIFAMGLYVVMITLATLLCYMLCPKDVSQMTYVMGFPVWFFAAAVIELIAFVIAMVFNQKFSKEFSLDAKSDDKEANK